MEKLDPKIAKDVIVGIAQAMHNGWGESFAEPDLSADRLAAYFTIARLSASEVPDFADALADRLLDTTIKKAREGSPFHADRLGHLCSPQYKRDLHQLPLMSRADLSGDSVVATSNVDFEFASYTSGTSSQRPLILERSLEEQSFVSKFSALLDPAVMDRDKPVALRLVNTWHGHLIDVPSAYHIIPVASGSVTALRTARDLLLREFRIGGKLKRISAIGGPLASLMRLTGFLNAENLREDLPEITLLQSTSEFLTARSRTVLETFWNCPVAERFGATESFMGAWSCALCEHYHPEPFGVTEFIGVDDDRVVSSGQARLVYTGFYPWMQKLPLIRYITGDVVTISQRNCPVHPIGYRPLGRLSDGFFKPGTRFVGDYEILDLLDAEPLVFRDIFYPWLPSPIRQVGSPPAYRFFDTADGKCGLEVGINFDSLKYPDHYGELLGRLRSRISAADLPIAELKVTQVRDVRQHEMF